jgi:hypothetical protein
VCPEGKFVEEFELQAPEIEGLVVVIEIMGLFCLIWKMKLAEDPGPIAIVSSILQRHLHTKRQIVLQIPSIIVPRFKIQRKLPGSSGFSGSHRFLH